MKYFMYTVILSLAIVSAGSACDALLLQNSYVQQPLLVQQPVYVQQRAVQFVQYQPLQQNVRFKQRQNFRLRNVNVGHRRNNGVLLQRNVRQNVRFNQFRQQQRFKGGGDVLLQQETVTRRRGGILGLIGGRRETVRSSVQIRR